MDVKKTKIMISSEKTENVSRERNLKYEISRNGVGSNSILCQFCKCWVYKECLVPAGTTTLTLSQRCGTVENESCTGVSFRRYDNVALQRCQDVALTLLQRRHNIKHWITRPFYYGLF